MNDVQLDGRRSMEKSGQRLRNFKRKMKERRRRRIRKSGSAFVFVDSKIVFVNSLTGYSVEGGRGEVNSNRDGFVTGNSPLLLICM